MIGQIFQHRGLTKKNRVKIKKRLVELALDKVVFKNFKTFDEKNILIKNFVYLLRLNNINEQDYFDSIILIKLILIYFHMKYVKNRNVLKKELQILKVINELEKKIVIIKNDDNYEKPIFIEYGEQHQKIKMYDNYNLLYNFIANIFYQPFRDKYDNILYFKYGYYLVFLINLTVMKKLLQDHTNVEIYLIKLNVTTNCHQMIGEITALYYNNFVQQINYYLHKY